MRQGIWRTLHWGPLTALTIIVFLFICSIIASAIWKHPQSSGGALNIFILLVWFLLILGNFFKALLLGPGLLPLAWRPDERDEKFLQWCSACKGFKAPRCHHCRSCQRCIMKMDHHCPWINNCVGHRNHQSFTLFLFFVVIGCSHATAVLVLCLVDHLLWDNGHLILRVNPAEIIRMNAGYLIFFFFGVGLSIGVTLSVGFLLYYQMKSISRNETGIETWILEKACRPGNERFVYPYNLGMWDNMKQVLVLTSNYIGDGVSWPVRSNCHKYAFTMEQLQQKSLKRKIMVMHAIAKDYSGSRIFYKWTFRSCMETPCCDESMLHVKEGDRVNISRWKRAWLYGQKMAADETTNAHEETDADKGWLPRHYTVELSDGRRRQKKQQ